MEESEHRRAAAERQAAAEADAPKAFRKGRKVSLRDTRCEPRPYTLILPGAARNSGLSFPVPFPDTYAW